MSVHLLKCGLRSTRCLVLSSASVACTSTAAVGQQKRFSIRHNSHAHHLQQQHFQSMNTEAVSFLFALQLPCTVTGVGRGVLLALSLVGINFTDADNQVTFSFVDVGDF